MSTAQNGKSCAVNKDIVSNPNTDSVMESTLAFEKAMLARDNAFTVVVAHTTIWSGEHISSMDETSMRTFYGSTRFTDAMTHIMAEEAAGRKYPSTCRHLWRIIAVKQDGTRNWVIEDFTTLSACVALEMGEMIINASKRLDVWWKSTNNTDAEAADKYIGILSDAIKEVPAFLNKKKSDEANKNMEDNLSK
jgi:hypothetical protein